MKKLLSFALCLATYGVAMAQQTGRSRTEEPPAPPLIKQAPNPSHWTMTFTPKTPPKMAATPDEIRLQKIRQRFSPLILSKEIFKNGNELAIFTTYEAGLTTEARTLNGFLYETPLRKGEAIRTEARPSGDFSEIYGISAQTFRGTVAWEGRKVHIYEPEPVEPPRDLAQPNTGESNDLSLPDKVVTKRVYIDADSRLPVALDTGVELVKYSFSSSGKTTPALDDRLALILKEAGDARTLPRSAAK